MKMVRIAYPWTSTNDTPIFTGIPPHVTLMSEFQQVTQELQTLKTSLPTTISSMLDGRGFSSTGMNTDKVIDYFKKTTEDIISQILEKTKASLVHTNEDGFNNGVSYVMDEEEIASLTPYKNLTNLTKTEQALKAREEHANSVACVKMRKLKVGFHHGKLTILPVDFSFPRMTTNQLVLNWLVGNIKKNFPPYCALSGTDFGHDKRLHKSFHEMKILMRYIECVARRHNCWIENNRDRTNENVNRMWEKIGNRFVIDPFMKKSTRRKETSWKTVYNRLALAKEFSKKGRTIYTNNPKEIIPIVERPSSPPGIKDPPQIATTDDVTETSLSASPPGIKDPPPQIATIVQNNENQFSEIGDDSTLTMLTNISTNSENTTFIEDHKVIQLKRNAVGMFEVTKCKTCPATTQHRCQYPVLNGECFDVDMGIRICGRAICNLCLGESRMRRCRYHRNVP